MTGEFVTLVPLSGARNERAIMFLQRIITTDETWLHNFDPETKEQSAVWKQSGSPPPVTARVTKSGGKTMFVMFADIRGMVLMHAVPKGTTVNVGYYSKDFIIE